MPRDPLSPRGRARGWPRTSRTVAPARRAGAGRRLRHRGRDLGDHPGPGQPGPRRADGTPPGVAAPPHGARGRAARPAQAAGHVHLKDAAPRCPPWTSAGPTSSWRGRWCSTPLLEAAPGQGAGALRVGAARGAPPRLPGQPPALRGAGGGLSRRAPAQRGVAGREVRLRRAHARQVARLALELFDGTHRLHGLGRGSGRSWSSRPCSTTWAGTSRTPAGTSTRSTSSATATCAGSTPWTSRSWPWSAATTARARRGRETPSSPRCPRPDRRAVRILSGLLRLADALDRSHRAVVKALSVREDGGALRLRCEVEGDAGLEQWAASRRLELLARTLERPLGLEFTSPRRRHQGDRAGRAGLTVREPCDNGWRRCRSWCAGSSFAVIAVALAVSPVRRGQGRPGEGQIQGQGQGRRRGRGRRPAPGGRVRGPRPRRRQDLLGRDLRPRELPARAGQEEPALPSPGPVQEALRRRDSACRPRWSSGRCRRCW